MTKHAYYILFDSHTDGLELYAFLKKAQLNPRISPAPRDAKACCGMSLLIDSEEISKVRFLLEKHEYSIDRIIELDIQIDATRDTFC